MLRKRVLHQTGRSLDAMKVGQALEADEMPDDYLMGESDIKPDFAVNPEIELEIPPRTGKGSGKEAWQVFAAQVTDVDLEVLERMGGRNDIIKMLEAKGTIPSE